uniref:Uncharacterized protein n=2 Tax=Meloidogyne TaxID=189290 RepID=A0A914M752_MELIC
MYTEQPYSQNYRPYYPNAPQPVVYEQRRYVEDRGSCVPCCCCFPFCIPIPFCFPCGDC